MYQKEEKMSLAKSFDLISGCSTGGIEAGCMAMGVPVSVIKDLYVDTEHGKGAKLFKRNWWWPVRGPKYKRYALMDEVTKQCKKYCPNPTMHNADPKLQIVSVDRCTDDNVYFKSWKLDWRGKLWTPDAIARSFAAAQYFGQISVVDEQKVYCDGGEGNANCTLQECIVELKKLGWWKEPCYILSIGTGYIDGRQSYKKASKQGNIGQTADFINMARRQSVRTQIRAADADRGVNRRFDFDRIDVHIDKKYDVLDGLKYTNEYVAYGKKMAHRWLVEKGDYLLKKLANDRTKKILQLDGGGLRGIIPIVFLAELETKLKAYMSDE